MSREDRAKWDAKFGASADHVLGEEPTHFLVEVAPALPATGRALDVACGEGRNAVWLAQRGLDVDAVDVSPVGLAKCRALADGRGVGRRVRTVERDLDAGLPERAVGPYDLVVCVQFHLPTLWDALRDALRPGGLLVLEAPTRANLDLGLGAPNSRFLADTNQVLDAARGLTVVFYREGLLRGRVRAQLAAQRPVGSPVRWTPAACPT
jgi:SAM-dependent methyltransferase